MHYYYELNLDTATTISAFMCKCQNDHKLLCDYNYNMKEC